MYLPNGVSLWVPGEAKSPARWFKPYREKNLGRAIDRSVREGGYWEKATFSVPAEVSDGRVQFNADKYIRRACNYWEQRGLKVHGTTKPVVDSSPRPEEPDRRRYYFYAWVSRRPQPFIMDVPDHAVPAMLQAGLRLLE